eukprot:Gb_13871 [translate_table: standard]
MVITNLPGIKRYSDMENQDPRGVGAVAADVLEVTREKQIDFILVRSHQLIMSIHEEALGWVHCFGEAMATSEQQRVVNLHSKMNNLSNTLHQNPETLEDLKSVLNVVAEIQSSGMDMEIEWLELQAEALNLSATLHTTKLKFTEITKKQAPEAQEQVLRPNRSPIGDRKGRSSSESLRARNYGMGISSQYKNDINPYSE